MKREKKDYYEILGVPRDATQEEIKRAYKRLVKEWHPDRHPENRKEAEQRFKEIQEAYEVLSDPQKRAMYDRFGYVGEQPTYQETESGGFFDDIFREFENIFNRDIFDVFFGERPHQEERREYARRGEDIRYEIEVTLSDLINGAEIPVEYERYETCPRCGGTGVEPNAGYINCPSCGGTGRIREERRSFFGYFVSERTCERCGGTGKIPREYCHECGGSGRVLRKVRKTVKIPPNVEDGTQLRITGGGNAGYYGGPYGDLIVIVRVKPDPRFKKSGSDLVYDITIDYLQAILGTTVEVPLPEGGTTMLKIPPGTQPETVFRLKGKGLPNRYGRRGDLIVNVHVEIPKSLSREERKVLEELAKKRGVTID
ncbi:molecular chaperone DnaJ [Thermotoga petrophila]|jgi:molecular chaperone DnaJ|uniref:molecular chaperone DnaJ n=1 Tax=Thermotoga petrophila TaxID=93929 RepID=UPI000E80A827|nr:chaperone protein DnaJ [Thermotoga sp.]MDK2893813.1 molecular chaperone DnaJ [Thermotoga sp.]MDK2898218.1 molecular chaperone DnaJ [Thermotoga sp.]HBT99769.1 molecular chaperone DnaJ [Thermotoga petrophila]